MHQRPSKYVKESTNGPNNLNHTKKLEILSSGYVRLYFVVPGDLYLYTESACEICMLETVYLPADLRCFMFSPHVNTASHTNRPSQPLERYTLKGVRQDKCVRKSLHHLTAQCQAFIFRVQRPEFVKT